MTTYSASVLGVATDGSVRRWNITSFAYLDEAGTKQWLDEHPLTEPLPDAAEFDLWQAIKDGNAAIKAAAVRAGASWSGRALLTFTME
jgi:hypothetical protein